MKCDQDLCLNLWYDLKSYFGKMNSILGSVVPLAMFSYYKLEAPMVIVNNKDIEEQVSVMKSWFSGYETGTVG